MLQAEMNKILERENVKKSIGGLTALSNVSFSVNEGQIKSLIGPNGAGKTTLYNIVTGIHRITQGAIWFFGNRIERTHKLFEITGDSDKNLFVGNYIEATANRDPKLDCSGINTFYHNNFVNEVAFSSWCSANGPFIPCTSHRRVSRYTFRPFSFAKSHAFCMSLSPAGSIPWGFSTKTCFPALIAVIV